MKRMLIMSSISFILLAGNVSIYADLAPPKPSPQAGKASINAGLEIVPDANATTARLQIPQASLEELRAALASEGDNTSVVQNKTESPSRTMLAGLFLFLSLSFGGVWFARAGYGRSQKLVAVVMLGMAVIGAAAVIASANIGPPPANRWLNLSRNLDAGRATQGPLKIEIVTEDDGIKLFVPLKPAKKSDRNPGEE
ncbi:MAG: hypothetical protein ACRD8U_11670 [Pyrinomonadaceae bacterium]